MPMLLQVAVVTQQTDPQGMVKVAEDAGIQAAAGLGANVAEPRNVALGHDIGGLIARRLNHTNPNMFGGMILTGTPNTEMHIATNYINGRLQREFKATGMERAPNVKASFKLGSQDFGQIPVAEIPMKWAEKTFGADPAAVFNSVNDLQKNSEFLRNLGNPTIPTVTIWGNENDPAVWRFFSSVNGAAIGATPMVTTDVSDEPLAGFIRTVRTEADGTITKQNWTGALKIALGAVTIVLSIKGMLPIKKESWFNKLLNGLGGTGVISGGGLIVGSFENFANAATARKTRDWLDDSQTIWNNLIGATRDELVSVDNRGAMTPMCRQGIDDPARGWSWYWNTLTQEERQRCWINEITQIRVRVQEESDGVLHKTTQQFGSALSPTNRVEARGANHEELLNHTGTTAAYNRVWRGDAGDFFITN
jgi:hypothetical protein